MVEANNPGRGGGKGDRDVWKEQTEKANKRKHKKAFGNGGKLNWAQKREKKRARKEELDRNGGKVEAYEISTYTIGSDRFNEYYKVSHL